MYSLKKKQLPCLSLQGLLSLPKLEFSLGIPATESLKRGRDGICQKFAKAIVAGLAFGLGCGRFEVASTSETCLCRVLQRLSFAAGATKIFLSTRFLKISSINLTLAWDGPM